MSVDITVFIHKDKLPTLKSLKHAINELDNKLSIDEEFSINDHEGFVPCSYNGEECGFEYWIEEVDDELLDEWEIRKEEISGRNMYLTFATRSGFTDLISSALTSSVFCKLSDGLSFDDDEELTINSSNCIEYGQNIVADAKRMIEEDKIRDELISSLNSDEKKQSFFQSSLKKLANSDIQDVRAIFGFPHLALVLQDNIVISSKNWEYKQDETIITSKGLPEDNDDEYNRLLQVVGESIDKRKIIDVSDNKSNELILDLDGNTSFKVINVKGSFGIEENWKLITSGIEFYFKDKKLICD